MKIKRENPEIIRIAYKQEPEDEKYGSCLWAFFDFDISEGVLNIQSDCGNYAYRWPAQGKGFLKILASMSEKNLLHKLCGKPKLFDAEGTIDDIKDYLNDMEIEEHDRERALKGLQEKFDDYYIEDSPDLGEFFVDEWNEEYSLDIDCVYELVRKKYSEDQRKIVHIFHEYISKELLIEAKETTEA